MNALEIARQTPPTTIGQLREYLDQLEASWTEQDDMYLGKFNDQPVCQAAYGRGVCNGAVHFDGTLGLIVGEAPEYLKLIADKYM